MKFYVKLKTDNCNFYYISRTYEYNPDYLVCEKACDDNFEGLEDVEYHVVAKSFFEQLTSFELHRMKLLISGNTINE